MTDEILREVEYSHFLQTLRLHPNRAMEFTDEDLKIEDFRIMLEQLADSGLIGRANSGKYCWLASQKGAECSDEMAGCIRKYILPPKATLADIAKPKP